MLMILVLFGTLGGLGAALSVPATSWAQKLPTGIPKLEERLSFVSRRACGDGGLGALHPPA